jgi:TonB family protein
MGADRTQLRSAQRELQSMRQVVQRGTEITRLSNLLQQSLESQRFVQPERDNAQFYWKELRALDGKHASLQPALQLLGAQMVGLARTAFAGGDIDETERLLAGMRDMNYASQDVTDLERDLAASRKRAAFLLDVVPITKLERLRQSSPRYPVTAERQGVEGSVDLEFTVTVDGSVKDIVVTSATPARVFDDAATRAVAQWKFRPVLKDGEPAEQRARVLLKFELPD